MDHQRGATTASDAVPQYAIEHPDDEVGAFARTRNWDPNMEDSKLEAIGADVEKDVKHEAEIEVEENSPYPEVQAAVANWDDMDVPANTLRAWFLGMFFVTIGSGLNCFFSLREPNIAVGPLVVQLCSYPIGKLMQLLLPRDVFHLFGLKFSLNPGPFNKKEHALITIMSNVAFGGGYGESPEETLDVTNLP
jgi:hypothetical protein